MSIQSYAREPKFVFNLRLKDEPKGKKYNEKKIVHLLKKFIDLNVPANRESLNEYRLSIKLRFPFAAKKIKSSICSYCLNSDVLNTILGYFDHELLTLFPKVSKKFRQLSIQKARTINPKFDLRLKREHYLPLINSLIKYRIKVIDIHLPLGTSIGDLNLMFNSFRNLNSLKLKSDFPIKLGTEMFFKLLAGNPNLTSFQFKTYVGQNHYFNDDYLSIGIFSPEKKHEKLRFLDLSRCPSTLTIGAIMVKCPNLESIKFGSKVIPASFYRVRTGCSDLRSLKLSSCGVIDQMFSAILKTSTKLKSIDLSHTFIKNPGFLQILSECTHLTSLDLTGCQIDNEGLEIAAESAKCTDLTSLNLSFTKVTERKISELRDRFARMHQAIMKKTKFPMNQDLIEKAIANIMDTIYR